MREAPVRISAETLAITVKVSMVLLGTSRQITEWMFASKSLHISHSLTSLLFDAAQPQILPPLNYMQGNFPQTHHNFE
jgi:hypothetical protein